MKTGLAIMVGRRKERHVFIHTLIGVGIGYFLLHPITMVIYWFQTNDTSVTFQNVTEAFNKSFFHAFYLHMMPMSLVFSIIGGLMGLVSGLYLRKIRNQFRKIQSQGFQLTESIQSIIRNGENEKVEFKSSFRYDLRKCQPNKILEEVIIKAIAGFMNASGGILIIGVDDNGYPIGLKNDYSSLVKQNRDGFEQKLMQVLADRLGTDLCPFVHIAFHQITGWEICSVYVEKAHRPVFVNEGGNTIFYLRIGNITRPLTTMETVEYLKIRENKNHH